MFTDIMTISVGTHENDNDVHKCSHMRELTYFSATKKQSCLSNVLVRESSNDLFGKSVSVYNDGVTVSVGSTKKNDDVDKSGHARLFPCYSTRKKWNALGNNLIKAASCT